MDLLTDERAAAGVTAAAFVASAAHIVSVVDQTNWIGFALAYPLGIDGLIYVGIRAMQKRRFWPGALAIGVGSFYSFAFNADAEGALRMDPILIAASMPVCLIASYVIAYTGKRKPAPVEVRTVEVPGPERVVVREVLPDLLPIAPFQPRVPEVPKIRTEDTEVPKVPARRVPVSSGRSPAWDIAKAVHVLMDPDDKRGDLAVGDLVGTGAKMIQRTRRAVRLLKENPRAEVPVAWKVPAAVVQVIRQEVTR